jgi:hypothetical protein
MLSKYEPFPERKRVDGDEWFSWAERLPPPGQEFEYRLGCESQTRRAMRRVLIERHAGRDIYCNEEAAAIVTEDGDICYGFHSSQSVVWRPVSIIVSE